MQYGMNLLLWTGEMNDGMIRVCEMLKEIGYDGVEVPIFNPALNYAEWGKRLDGLGLQRTAVTVRTVDDNPISAYASVRQLGIEATKRTLDCCAALGATHLVGPFHSALGHFSGKGPTEDEWKWGVYSMQSVAEYAGLVGVMLGVECLNRFETYLLNTHADAAKFVREVHHHCCFMIYDSFHANIEEKSIKLAIDACADVLCHVHISENDRSTPGKGNVDWPETFDALRRINYNGWMMVEAFGQALPDLAAATKIWRRMFESEEQLSRDALAFMKREVAYRW